MADRSECINHDESHLITNNHINHINPLPPGPQAACPPPHPLLLLPQRALRSASAMISRSSDTRAPNQSTASEAAAPHQGAAVQPVCYVAPPPSLRGRLTDAYPIRGLPWKTKTSTPLCHGTWKITQMMSPRTSVPGTTTADTTSPSPTMVDSRLIGCTAWAKTWRDNSVSTFESSRSSRGSCALLHQYSLRRFAYRRRIQGVTWDPQDLLS